MDLISGPRMPQPEKVFATATEVVEALVKEEARPEEPEGREGLGESEKDKPPSFETAHIHEMASAACPSSPAAYLSIISSSPLRTAPDSSSLSDCQACKKCFTCMVLISLYLAIYIGQLDVTNDVAHAHREVNALKVSCMTSHPRRPPSILFKAVFFNPGMSYWTGKSMVEIDI